MTGDSARRRYLRPVMKRLSLIVAAVAFSLGACERHTWEDKDKNGNGVIEDNEKGTKRLYKAHHAEGEGGDDHDEGGDKKDADAKHPKEGDSKKGAE